MGYSKVKLFQNTKFYSNQNYKIDSIEEFLTTLSSSVTPPIVFDSVQYFKPMSIDKELKLTCPQKDIKDFHKYNYARIELISESAGSEVVDWILYYFVMKVEWISSGAVKLTLRMDTLNTFMDTMIFSPRTMVEREHIDRWNYNGYIKDAVNHKITILRNIPYTNEGLTPQKYPSRYGDDNNFSYNPIFDTLGNIIIDGDTYSWACVFNWDSESKKLCPLYIGDWSDSLTPKLEIGGTIHDLGKITDLDLTFTKNIKTMRLPYGFVSQMANISTRDSSNPLHDSELIQGGEIRSIDNPDSEHQLYGIAVDVQKIYNSSNYGPVISKKVKLTFEDVDFTEIPRHIINIIDVDYSSILSAIVNNNYFKANNYSNESSLYASEFFDLCFIYGSFTYNLALDDIIYKSGLSNYRLIHDKTSINYNSEILSISFNPSYILNNDFNFTFSVGRFFTWRTSNPLQHIFIIRSNNLLPQFYDEYINYMRNGYNYDVKILQNERDKRKYEWENITSTKEAMKAFTLNPIGFIRSYTNAIIGQATHNQMEYYNRMNEDLQMEKKISELKGAKVGVENTDSNINLINSVNPFNKLSILINTPNKEFIKPIEDYFYYYGNKVRQYKVPTHNNRALFDYLKCEADFINRNNVPNSECYNDIIERLKNGITYIHKYLNTWTFDTDYKENVENGLLAIL